jgi:hypothetical protein
MNGSQDEWSNIVFTWNFLWWPNVLQMNSLYVWSRNCLPLWSTWVFPQLFFTCFSGVRVVHWYPLPFPCKNDVRSFVLTPIHYGRVFMFDLCYLYNILWNYLADWNQNMQEWCMWGLLQKLEKNMSTISNFWFWMSEIKTISF